ncbi:MAG: biotin--[acetyl-CoA-carboxylase] ligase [Candidatus Eremiobacteraeota bacterium]|nr:biotin--[acetyl-CoA-carboxylase] ligase [Candidatus Eremiobacteraeota bacterium]MBC5802324.1 biotin--[acetyl-CoA-carboxylase] ligase [Candidatus Eremiobacteraeota bacterium]MBC5822649.1 biotin--[acetyl-CoA-carboxylase] ligase [Candidatus Eremiobacteraeota bacterium]
MFRRRFSSRTDSTNDDAATLLGTRDGEGLVLLADYQCAGRGRRGRAWIAPPRSALLFTAILPKPVPARALWCVTFWTALGVAAGVEATTGLRLTLQWPNDLLLGGRKCCGILCISRVVGTQAWVGCGVGLNVHRPADETSVAGIVPAPAFLSDRVANVERSTLLDAVLTALWTTRQDLDDPRAIARAWERRAGLDGTPYRLHLDAQGETLSAIARRLDDDGSLIVSCGELERRVTLADARVLRDVLT